MKDIILNTEWAIEEVVEGVTKITVVYSINHIPYSSCIVVSPKTTIESILDQLISAVRETLVTSIISSYPRRAL